MKVAIVLALVAACVASSYSAPAIQAVDWSAVGAKLGEIEALVTQAVQQVKTIANNDNAAVGSDISSQLDAAAVKARAVLEEATGLVQGQSLTVAKAQELFGKLKDILAGVQNDLQDELAQLSSGASGQIRDIFYSAYAQAELKAQEVYALLAGKIFFAVDWSAVGTKVGEIETLVTEAVQQIKTIANNDNAAVGSGIASQLDAAAVKARAVLEQAKAKIQAQTLTVTEAQGFFGQLKDILAGVQNDLQDELAQLSSGASGQIRDLFYSTYAQAELKAQEIYGLLAGKSILAVNWPSVGEKVAEIEALVTEGVQQVKTIANNDNAAVGSGIASQLDAAAVKARAVLEQAKAKIQAQSLTVAEAEGFFAQLKDILAGVQNDLQDELAQLSSGASGQIRDIFYSTYAQAELKAQEVYALLAAKSLFAVDWSAVGTKVREIETLVTEAVQQVKSIANNDNAAVGSSISSQLDAAAAKARDVLAQAAAAIGDQSLTEESAKALFTQLKDILSGVQQDLQDELAQLSSGAASSIRDLFYSAYAQAELKAQEIYALLRQ